MARAELWKAAATAAATKSGGRSRRSPELRLLLFVLLAVPLQAQFRESITVERILLDVRVTDTRGEAILGLEPTDFDVRVGGAKAEVLSATWIDDEIRFEPEADGSEPAPPPGRLFVFFIQTDFAKATERIRGQMHFLRYAEQLVEMLTPDDRVAVVSFDSHLKFRLDFTSEHEPILEAMRNSLRVDEPKEPPIVPSPSLGARLEREEMKKAADAEAGLIVVGNALRGIPGPKTMLFMGWGLGRLTSAGVRMTHRYDAARRTLDAARVTVFSLDTTNADYHSLEVGLEKAARDTGGFYAKTHQFAGLAVDRLRRTLVGHYELELRRPDALARGTHVVDVGVSRRGVTVLAPSSWMDR